MVDYIGKEDVLVAVADLFLKQGDLPVEVATYQSNEDACQEDDCDDHEGKEVDWCENWLFFLHFLNHRKFTCCHYYESE